MEDNNEPRGKCNEFILIPLTLTSFGRSSGRSGGLPMPLDDL